MVEPKAGGRPFLVVMESVTEDGTHDWRLRRDSYPSVGGQSLQAEGAACAEAQKCVLGELQTSPRGAGKGEVNYEWNQVMAGPVGDAGNIGLILHFRILAFNLFQPHNKKRAEGLL